MLIIQLTFYVKGRTNQRDEIGTLSRSVLSIHVDPVDPRSSLDQRWCTRL